MEAGQGINSPDLKTVGGTPTRAIKDSPQAAQIFTALTVENYSRNLKNARIMAKYNAERPYKQDELEAEGLSWKANFSSKVLSTLIDKVSPRFTKAVDSVKYITSSKFPDSVINAEAKTEAFRKEVTQTARRWPGWRDFIAEIAQENALFGYTSAGYTHEYTWRMKHYRQDVFFCPVGTKQCAATAQIISFKEFLMPHELFELIRDKEPAKDAGWNVENALTSINDAMPETARSKNTDSARRYEDLARESSVGTSYHSGAKVVVLGHVFAQEVSGKVSHYIVDGRSNKELFVREDRFDSMTDVGVFFTFQQGNGTLHGSKGIGREVYAMAGILERSRNEVVDRLQLSGKLVLQGDEKKLQRFRAHVVGNALLISSDFTISEHSIDGKIEPFFKLDQYMRQLLDEVAGNVSPKPMDQAGEGMRSPAAWNVTTAREEESKDMVIERFLNQFSVLVTAIQKRMCHKDCADEDAQEMQKRLLKLMKREELDEISQQPSATVVQDLTGLERQQIITVATENRGNPLYNQKALERRKLTAQLGSEFADAVLMPDNDPTVTAEQSREQQLEIFPLHQGQNVPVSPRDNHVIHLTVLQPVIQATLELLATDGSIRPALNAMLAHATSHMGEAVKLKDPAQNVSKFAGFIADVQNKLKMLDAHDQALKAKLDAGGQPDEALGAGAEAAQAVPPLQPAPPQE